MAYLKPYTYVDGDVLTAPNQGNNDEEAKVSINQKTVKANIADDTFNYDSIQRGELNPINNHHQFTTGEVHGNFSDNIVRERSYFTSEVKANDQISSVQYLDIFHTGDRVTLEYSGKVFITFGAAFVSGANSTTTSGPGNGKYDSIVKLRIFNETTNSLLYIEGTVAYSFEETLAASAGTFDPGSSIAAISARRWIGWQWMTGTLSAGTYQFCVVINPKVEEGHASARQFTIETFYT